MNIRLLSAEGGKGLYIELKPDDLGENVTLDFYRDSASTIEATLLRRYVQKALADQMQQVRQVSYLRGWRDAKSKRTKRDWFPCCVNVPDWEKKEAGL